MSEICRWWTRSVFVYGFMLTVSRINCQYAAHHPVSFVQTPGKWNNPYTSRNPSWHQFSTPRKRSPNTNPVLYNGQMLHQPYQHYNNYQSPAYDPRFAQHTQRYSQYQERRGPVDLVHSESRVPNDPRLLSESAFTRFSETLGAINTVGHYIVDMVSDGDEDDESNPNLQQLPQALYTISKNVLGKNVTEKIAPIVKTSLVRVLPDAPITRIATADLRDEVKACTTPEGETGLCEDLSNCPQLLLNLVNLRESFCFRDLFVPGVCCPKNAVVSSTTIAEKPLVSTTSRPTFLLPVTTQKPPQKLTTEKPSAVLSLTTKRPKPQKPVVTLTTRKPAVSSVTTTRPVVTTSFYTPDLNIIANYSNIVDEKDCGQRETEGGRIVGGTKSEPGEWPWMAAIYLQGSKRKEFWCGGTLVGKRHVLTAAHCTRDTKQRPFPPRQFIVRLGDVDLASDDEPSRPVNVRVVAVKAHEEFSRVGYYNDIAVLVLAENIQKSKYVIPICLPYGDARQRFEGSVATVVGWGTTRYGGIESSTQLEARLPVWDNEECNRSYFQPITDGFLCAGYHRGKVDACQGDSGGPLMLEINGRWTQIGVVSFGNKCGEPGYPGVYTRVTHYLPWLQSHLL